jgi:hypothetical protein
MIGRQVPEIAAMGDAAKLIKPLVTAGTQQR